MTYEQVRQITQTPEFKQRIIRDTLVNISKIKKLEDNGLTEQEAIKVLLDEKRINEPVIIH